MARIKIELPEKFSFETIIPIRITDLNYGNHVGNDAFVSILHEARVQWLKGEGYTELNFAGAGLIMSDLVIEFKNESFYGDIVEVCIYAGETSRVSFELYYQLSAARNLEKIILANAKTRMIAYNYEKKKAVSLNDTIIKVLTEKI